MSGKRLAARIDYCMRLSVVIRSIHDDPERIDLQLSFALSPSLDLCGERTFVGLLSTGDL